MAAVVSSEEVAETGKRKKEDASDRESTIERWNRLRNNVDCAACGVDPKTGLKMTEEQRRRTGKQLREELKEFVEMHAEEIVQAAAAGISQKEALGIKDALKNLDSFVTGELLFAIQETKEVHALTNGDFLGRMKALDDDIAGSLLFEVRATGNVAALTDERLFQGHAASFFNRLGTEAASEWFYSIGDTGNVAALTSREALSDKVLGVIRQDGKVSSELSKAIGETDRVDALTSDRFLGFMKSVDTAFASEYMSAIWCTGKVDELTNGSTFGSFRNGATGLWKDVARMFEGSRKGIERVIMAKPGDRQHDRGAKLAMQALFASGHSVVYIGDVQTHAQVLAAARREGATAIGFSMASNLDKKIALETVKAVSVQGLSGIRIFGGGMLAQEATKELEQSGIRLFNGSAGMLEFLNGRRVQRADPVAVIHGNGYGMMQRAVLAANSSQVQNLAVIRSMTKTNGTVHMAQLSVSVPIHMVKDIRKAVHHEQHESVTLNGVAKTVAKIRAELVMEKNAVKGMAMHANARQVVAVSALLANASLHRNMMQMNAEALLVVGMARQGSKAVANAERLAARMHAGNAYMRFGGVSGFQRRAAAGTQTGNTAAMRHDAVVTVGGKAQARKADMPKTPATTRVSTRKGSVSMTAAYEVPSAVSLGAIRSLSTSTNSRLVSYYTISRQKAGKVNAPAAVQAKKAISVDSVASVSAASSQREGIVARQILRQQLSMVHRIEKPVVSGRARTLAAYIQSQAQVRMEGMPARKGMPVISSRDSRKGLLKRTMATILRLILGSEIVVVKERKQKGMIVANRSNPSDQDDPESSFV
ncbi:MAG: cobalamin-dependent protein [Candidatus Micrarchaeota archaeon]|nr:cobalamin-dependent protein [Candidatus Micrarchaeota archaeon]